MNSNAAGAEFHAIQHEVVALGANFPGRGLEFVEIFIDNAGKGVLSADPGFVGFAPLKKWEAGKPQEFPLRLFDLIEGFAELQTELTGDERSGFGALDLFFCRNGNHEVASLCVHGIGELFDVLWSNQLLDSGGRAFGGQLDEISSAPAE